MMNLILMFLMTLIISSSKNPMKTSTALLTLGLLSFLKMYTYTGNSWMSLILCMLFGGGILMMMMILSSILPNEPEGLSLKFFFILILLILSLFEFKLFYQPSSQIISMTKWILQTKMSFVIMISIMIWYFMAFLITISKFNYPMRSLT